MSAVRNDDDVSRAQLALEVAISKFNWTTEREHGRFALDAAIYTLNAAELRLRAAIQRDRSLFCLDPLDKQTNRGRSVKIGYGHRYRRRNR